MFQEKILISKEKKICLLEPIPQKSGSNPAPAEEAEAAAVTEAAAVRTEEAAVTADRLSAYCEKISKDSPYPDCPNCYRQ